ncbi:GATOR complex protein MIOS [Taenia crassiceps]|uniref:GATOR complex protein MIOS n=1 Tax=Taenia crassiceps TaxID=6207 RepID=A0ABR4QRE9_9CEST
MANNQLPGCWYFGQREQNIIMHELMDRENRFLHVIGPHRTSDIWICTESPDPDAHSPKLFSFRTMASLTDIVWSPNHEDRFCVIYRNIIFLLKIADFDESVSESGRRFSHTSRFSAFLHWNPWRTSLLAQGLDRGKPNRASSVLVWDVIRETGSKQQFDANANSEFSSGLPADSLYNMDKFVSDIYIKDRRMQSFCDRPLCDACQNESVISFAWVSKNSFVVGLASRHLKLYDISDTAKTIQMTQTRLVNGLTSDPLLPTRFASFCQNQIGLWTSENLEKPAYVFTERKDVVCMKWSPLREGWLGVLLDDSTDIRVYNTLLTFSRPMEECEQFLFELRATTSGGDDGGANVAVSVAPFVSFAWHGSIVNCIITIDQMGCLNVTKVNEMTALTWSPNQTLLWTVGSAWLGLDRTGLFGPRGYTSHPGISAIGQEGLVVPPSSPSAPSLRRRHLHRRGRLPERLTDSIAQLAAKFNANLDSMMQKRADAGYGLEVVEAPYSEIVADDPQLKSLWILIEYLQECVEDWAPYGKSQDPTWGGMRGRTSTTTSLRCQGALTILCGDEPTASEAIDGADWQGIDAHLPFPRYSSFKRSRVLRMCMWPLDAPADVQRRVFESVCSDLEFERAAAMALINLQFDWALSFLSRASEYRRTKEVGAGLEQVIGASTASIALTASETDLIGLALSGFSDSRNHFWRSACADVLGRLHNPYLRLMFKFLTVARGDFYGDVDFMEILENENLFLIDRLAFACLYLNDEKLSEYVLSTFHRMLGDGRLEAVLLTGLSSSHFFDLLQHYVDLTFDVQTAAILGLHACYLCRRAAPPTPTTANVATTATLTTSTPSAARVVGAGQSRLRLRGFRNGADRSSLPPAAALANAPTLSADKVVANLGGRQLANWVETYRDMLDRWRMWFYRVDFDNYYTTRLVTPFFYSGVQSRTSSGSTSKDISLQSTNKPLPPITPVRGIGLPAATSQIFASCIYCGWRLGGVVRGTVEEPASTPVPSPATTPTGPTAMAVAAVASGAGAGCGTSMHAGGGKQTICWHCLKPLPRCSICLMHMGSEVGELNEAKAKSSRKKATAHTAGKAATSTKGNLSDTTGVTPLEVPSDATVLETNIISKTAEAKKSTKINLQLSKKPEAIGGSDDASRGGPLRLASWFVWCQACRHGGHASHIFDWFYGGSGGSGIALSPNLIECPVNGCLCHCASLDSSVPQPRPTPPPPTTASTAGNAAAGDETSGDNAAMVMAMCELTLSSALSPLSSSSSSLASPALTPMDASPRAEEVGGKMLRRSPVTPASVPKNRREIVDPVVLAMTGAEEGEEAIEAED